MKNHELNKAPNKGGVEKDTIWKDPSPAKMKNPWKKKKNKTRGANRY